MPISPQSGASPPAAMPATWQLRILYLLLALTIVTQIHDDTLLYRYLTRRVGAVHNLISTGFASDVISVSSTFTCSANAD